MTGLAKRGSTLPPTTAASLDAEVGQHGLRILAAEDNEVNQLVLKTLLNQLGIDVTVVANGRLAVEAWRDGGWDAILMDMQMPEMDGLAATRAIRAEETASGVPRVPIIALTANAMAHQKIECLAAGMDAHVPKPIEIRRLIAALEDVLQTAPPQAAARQAS